jgi:hypothetical protein
MCFRSLSLKLRSYLYFLKKGYHNYVFPPSNYKLIYEDSFNKFNSEFWRYSMPWGIIHPGNLNIYYPADDSCSLFDESLNGSLFVFNSPKIFYKSDIPWYNQNPNIPEKWISEWATGVISSIPWYTYGWFECEIKLPIGTAQWPAFWLIGKDIEIDIFEAYTKENPYKVKIESNIHLHDKNESIGAHRSYIYEPNQRFIQYALHWTESFVKIYMDGLLVIDIRDKNILKNLNQPQYIVISNGVKTTLKVKPSVSHMKIRKFKIYQQ